MYTVEGLLGEQIAVHCSSEEEAEKLMYLFQEKGYHWWDGEPATAHTYWTEKDQTCYDVEDEDGEIGNCRLDWYLENEYTVIEFADLVEEYECVIDVSDLDAFLTGF